MFLCRRSVVYQKIIQRSILKTFNSRGCSRGRTTIWQRHGMVCRMDDGLAVEYGEVYGIGRGIGRGMAARLSLAVECINYYSQSGIGPVIMTAHT